jgi:hypothetical protein
VIDFFFYGLNTARQEIGGFFFFLVLAVTPGKSQLLAGRSQCVWRARRTLAVRCGVLAGRSQTNSKNTN